VGYALQHLAALAALRQYEAVEIEARQHRGAAKVLGYADARFEAMGAARLRNQEQQEYDRILVALRGPLGPQALADLMAAGAAMTEDQAVEAALSLCIPGRAEADG
jgi:protein-L-isoaspartate O-methyltransferase